MGSELLFRESQDEVNAREALGLVVCDQQPHEPSGRPTKPSSDERMEVDSSPNFLCLNPEVSEEAQQRRAIPQPKPLPAASVESSTHPPTNSIPLPPLVERSMPKLQGPQKAPDLPKAELRPTMDATAIYEDEDDEDIPGINMDSDSD